MPEVVLPFDRHAMRDSEYEAALERDDAAGRVSKAFRLYTAEEIERRPKPQQNVEGVLAASSTAAMVGAPGSGKGFVAIDLVFSVALGLDWHGHRTRGGTCVYIALERQAGLGARVRSWKSFHNRPGRAPVLFTVDRFSLFSPNGADRLLETLAQLEEPPRIVVVDTMAKAMLPGDENSTLDMGQFVANLQRVAEYGPTVLAIHHINASGLRERGNSSFRGDVDTLIMLEKADDDGGIRLKSEKQNELAPFAQINLRVIPHGESAVAVTAAAVTAPMLSTTQLEMLKSLRIVGLGSPASCSGWLKAWGGKDRTFYENRSALVRKGYVGEVESGKRSRYVLTAAGESAVAADCGNTADQLRPQSDSQILRDCGGLVKAPASAVQSEAGERIAEPDFFSEPPRNDGDAADHLAEVDERLGMRYEGES